LPYVYRYLNVDNKIRFLAWRQRGGTKITFKAEGLKHVNNDLAQDCNTLIYDDINEPHNLLTMGDAGIYNANRAT